MINRTNINAFIILVVTFCGCKSNNQKTNESQIPVTKDNKVINIDSISSNQAHQITDRNVYDDIDLFKLKGIREIETPTRFPYIKIESNYDLTKRVVYRESMWDSTVRVYQKKGDYWTTSYEFKADTGYCTTYEFITPTKIIELEYLGTFEKKDYHLHSVALIESNKETAYSYFGDKGIVIEPNPENFDIVRKGANSVYFTEFDYKGDTLRITNNYLDKRDNKIFFSDTSFYDTKNRSWFWWQYFGLNTKIK